MRPLSSNRIKFYPLEYILDLSKCNLRGTRTSHVPVDMHRNYKLNVTHSSHWRLKWMIIAVIGYHILHSIILIFVYSS